MHQKIVVCMIERSTGLKRNRKSWSKRRKWWLRLHKQIWNFNQIFKTRTAFGEKVNKVQEMPFLHWFFLLVVSKKLNAPLYKDKQQHESDKIDICSCIQSLFCLSSLQLCWWTTQHSNWDHWRSGKQQRAKFGVIFFKSSLYISSWFLWMTQSPHQFTFLCHTYLFPWRHKLKGLA